jgi:SlyX protein
MAWRCDVDKGCAMARPMRRSPAMEDRIIELEVRVAYQDKIIADLDDVLRAFTSQVEALRRELVELKERFEGDQPDLGPADDAPPHY